MAFIKSSGYAVDEIIEQNKYKTSSLQREKEGKHEADNRIQDWGK